MLSVEIAVSNRRHTLTSHAADAVGCEIDSAAVVAGSLCE
jgi:hypothetical protein